MFAGMTEQFRVVFEKWRSDRDEWRALIQAIRADAENDKLLRLAGPAGVPADELRELKMVRQRALRDQAEAAKAPAAAKRLAAMEKEIARLRTAAEKATADAHPEALGALQAAIDQRDRFWQTEYIGPDQSRRYLEEVAIPLGVL